MTTQPTWPAWPSGALSTALHAGFVTTMRTLEEKAARLRRRCGTRSSAAAPREESPMIDGSHLTHTAPAMGRAAHGTRARPPRKALLRPKAIVVWSILTLKIGNLKSGGRFRWVVILEKSARSFSQNLKSAQHQNLLSSKSEICRQNFLKSEICLQAESAFPKSEFYPSKSEICFSSETCL